MILWLNIVLIDLMVEHSAHPVLAGHKSGKGEADHKPHGYVATGGGDQ